MESAESVAEQGSDVIGSCDIGTLQKLEKENPNGLFLIVSQTGCGDCDEMKAVLNEVVKDSKPVVDANIIEDNSCLSLAEQLKVGVTPTLFYFEGGKELARLEPGNGLTWDQVRGKVRELKDRPPVAAAVPA